MLQYEQSWVILIKLSRFTVSFGSAWAQKIYKVIVKKCDYFPNYYDYRNDESTNVIKCLKYFHFHNQYININKKHGKSHMHFFDL